MEGLPKKYKISTPYTEKIEKGNKQISVKFDDDTLELRVTHQGESEFNYTALLIYSDKNYLLSLDEKKREKDKRGALSLFDISQTPYMPLNR
ncbi:hypothetical protein P2G70_07390 [Mannheimia haemolytica]|nr:hypothetical protein [Mannheimia haemolytica]